MSDNANYEAIRIVAAQLGLASPTSNESIYDAAFLNKIKRKVFELFETMESQQEKIDELEKENAELKAHVNQQQTNLDRLWHLAEDLGACSEYLKVNFASGSYIPEQSLAQHDKGVALKTIDDACQYVTAKFPNGFLHSMAEFKKKHLNQK